MCTLAVAWRVDRRFPLVVAANRDERLGRPSEGWALRDGRGGIRFAAPRDATAGGTWIGLSARGVFAGLTNYHAPLEWYPDLARRSRGDLVPLALGAPSAAAARDALRGEDPARWNPFHLLVADAEAAFLWWYDGERAELAELSPGLHVLTERSPTGACPRGELVRARWPVDPAVPRLRELLTVHPLPSAAARSGGDPGTSSPPDDRATCIHRDPVYGTRSSAVLRVPRDLAAAELFTADVRPCAAPLEDRSEVVAALARTRSA